METKKGGPKDVFFHLLAILTLYVAAANFITLIFQFINISIPDPLNPYEYELEAAHTLLRWAISSLIVVFPAYVGTTWFLNKAYSADPAKRNLRIRRWLIYFTLFVAALIILGDLVTLVYNLLGGDFTSRFILKTLTILFVAGSIFWYYLADIRKHKIE